MKTEKINLTEEKLYKAKYFILETEIKKIVMALKKDIYDERIPPTALKHISDLKFYLMCAENQDRLPPVRNSRIRRKKVGEESEDFNFWIENAKK